MEKPSQKRLLQFLDLLRIGTAMTSEVMSKLEKEGSQSTSELQITSVLQRIKKVEVDIKRLTDKLNRPIER